MATNIWQRIRRDGVNHAGALITIAEIIGGMERKIMGVLDDIKAKLSETDSHIDGMHADILSLKDQLAAAIASGGGAISAADAQTILDSAAALAAKASGFDAETP